MASHRAIPVIQNHQVRDILERLDTAFARHADASAVACRAGCDACCHGPFDVSELDLWLVVEGVATLPDEPRRRALRAIRTSATAQRAWLEARHGALPALLGLSSVGDDAFDAMCDALEHLPCPLLQDGRCAVYHHRPEPCRLRGVRWESTDGVLDFGCPEGLNDGVEGPLSGYIDVSGRLARLQHGLALQERASDERTTIALGLAALIGGT